MAPNAHEQRVALLAREYIESSNKGWHKDILPLARVRDTV